MEDWVAIYHGNPLAARSLADELERAGVRTFEREHDTGAMTPSGQRFHQTAVWVPPEEREHAERVVTHWQTHHAVRVQSLSARLARVFALSLLAPAAWWGGAIALPERVPTPSPEGAGVAWLASFVAVSQLENRRYRGERIVLDREVGDRSA